MTDDIITSATSDPDNRITDIQEIIASPEIPETLHETPETLHSDDAQDINLSIVNSAKVQTNNVLKEKIEAVLFVTDRPLHAQAIARIVNADIQLVRQMLLEIITDYESRQTALEIAQDNGYIIEIKPEYASVMQEFLPIDIPTSLLRTLSAIAIRAPVAQSEIVQMRGAGAYDHIRDLVERDLIHKKEDGRSPILTTTKKFQQYFRLSSDGSELRKYVKQQEKLVAAQKQAQAETQATESGAESAAEFGVQPSAESSTEPSAEPDAKSNSEPNTQPDADVLQNDSPVQVLGSISNGASD